MHTKWKLIGRTDRRHKQPDIRTNGQTYGQGPTDNGQRTMTVAFTLRANKQNYGQYESAHTTTQNHLKAIISGKHGGHWVVWMLLYMYVCRTGNGSVFSPCSKHGVQWINLRYVTKPQLQAPVERQRRETKRQLWKEQRVQLQFAIAIPLTVVCRCNAQIFWGHVKWRRGLDHFLFCIFLGAFPHDLVPACRF